MEWINIDSGIFPPSPSKVIVKTITKHKNTHVLEVSFHTTIDEKGVAHHHWGCNNQLVTKWLKEF